MFRSAIRVGYRHEDKSDDKYITVDSAVINLKVI